MFNGSQLKQIVLDAMTARGIEAERISRARSVYFPETLQILGTSMKVEKGEAKNEVLTAIIYLSPERESIPYGGKNTCPFASAGCAAACLGANSARLRMTAKNGAGGLSAKLWKTLLLTYRPDIFKEILFRDLRNLETRARSKGLSPACRPNGCSDIAWEVILPDMFTEFPGIQFYDYTKIPSRFDRPLPPNYHLTFSRSESNHLVSLSMLDRGVNVAVVFSDREQAIESGFHGHEVFDADKTDYRPADPVGVVGLSVKANVKDHSGFVVTV